MASFRYLDDFDVDEDGILQDLRRRQSSGIPLDENGIYQDSSQPLPYLTQHTDSGIGRTPSNKLSDPFNKPALSAPEFLSDGTHPLDEKSLNLSDYSTKEISYFEESLRSVNPHNYLEHQHAASAPDSRDGTKTQSSQEHSDPQDDHFLDPLLLKRRTPSHGNNSVFEVAPPTTTPQTWTPIRSPRASQSPPVPALQQQRQQRVDLDSPIDELKRESEAVIDAIIRSSAVSVDMRSESEEGRDTSADEDQMDLEVANLERYDRDPSPDQRVPNGRHVNPTVNDRDEGFLDKYLNSQGEAEPEVANERVAASEPENEFADDETNRTTTEPEDEIMIQPVEIHVEGPSQDSVYAAVAPSPKTSSKKQSPSSDLDPPYQFQDMSHIREDDDDRVAAVKTEVSAFPMSIDYGASIPFIESGEDGAETVDQLIKQQMLEHAENEAEISHAGDIAHSLIEFEATEVQRHIEAERRRLNDEADVLGEFLQNTENTEFNNNAKSASPAEHSGRSGHGSQPGSRRMSPSLSKIPQLKRRTPGQSPARSRSNSQQSLNLSRGGSRRGSRDSLIPNLKLKPTETGKNAGGQVSSHASDSDGSKGTPAKKSAKKDNKTTKKSPPKKKSDPLTTPSSYKIRSQPKNESKTGPMKTRSSGGGGSQQRVPNLDLDKTALAGENSESDLDVTQRDLRKRLKAEGHTRKQQDEVIQQLQDDYDKLLTKYALAEVTIDQLRLGAKLNLYSDSPTPVQFSTGHVPSAHHVSAFNISHMTQAGMIASTPSKQKAFSMGDIHHTATGGSRPQSQNGFAQSHSTQMTPVNFDMDGLEEPSEFSSDPVVQVTGSGDSIKMSLMFQAQSLAEQMESFRVLLEEEQLSVEEQERIWDKIKADYEKLQEDYKQAKDDTDLLKRLNMSGPENEFDDDKTLQGDLFRLGMKLDDLHEKVEDNIKLAKRRTPFQDMGRPMSQLQRPSFSKSNMATSAYSQPQTPIDKVMQDGDRIAVETTMDGADLDPQWRQLQRDYNALLDLYRRMKKMPKTPERDKDIDALTKKLLRLYNQAPDPSLLHRLPSLSDDESTGTLTEPSSPVKSTPGDHHKLSPGAVSPPESNYLNQDSSYKEELPNFSMNSSQRNEIGMQIPVGATLMSYHANDIDDDPYSTEHLNKRLGRPGNDSLTKNKPKTSDGNSYSSPPDSFSQSTPGQKTLRPGELDADSGFIGSESSRSARLKYQQMLQERHQNGSQPTTPIKEASDEPTSIPPPGPSALPVAAIRPPPQQQWTDSDMSSARDHTSRPPLQRNKQQRSLSSVASESAPSRQKNRHTTRSPPHKRASRPTSRHFDRDASESEGAETQRSGKSERIRLLKEEINQLKQDLEKKQDKITIPAVAVPATPPYWNPALMEQYGRFNIQQSPGSSREQIKENVKPEFENQRGRGRHSSADDYDSYDQYSTRNNNNNKSTSRLRRITEDSRITSDDDYLSEDADAGVERGERKIRDHLSQRDHRQLKKLQNSSLDYFRSPPPGPVGRDTSREPRRVPMKAFATNLTSTRYESPERARRNDAPVAPSPSRSAIPEHLRKYDRYLSRSQSLDRSRDERARDHERSRDRAERDGRSRDRDGRSQERDGRSRDGRSQERDGRSRDGRSRDRDSSITGHSTPRHLRRSYSMDKIHKSEKRSDTYSEDGRRSRSRDRRQSTQTRSIPCPHCGGSGKHSHTEINYYHPPYPPPQSPLHIPAYQIPTYQPSPQQTTQALAATPPMMIPVQHVMAPSPVMMQPIAQPPQPIPQPYIPQPSPQPYIPQPSPQPYAPQPSPQPYIPPEPVAQPVPIRMAQQAVPIQMQQQPVLYCASPVPMAYTQHQQPQMQSYVAAYQPSLNQQSSVHSTNQQSAPPQKPEPEKFIQLPLRVYEEKKDVKYFVREYSESLKNEGHGHRRRSDRKSGTGSKFERGSRRSASLPRNLKKSSLGVVTSDNESIASESVTHNIKPHKSKDAVKTGSSLLLDSCVKLAKDIEQHSGKIRDSLHDDVKRSISMQQLYV
ncbi:uncharacterized protein LOC141908433 [Tubulanus polymorphus]|uniref:uncharacterized protein LOC141908433 n=1 Tax=Tubulanus polymorphus TaxID=672921 RepID=UPI003DA4EA33